MHCLFLEYREDEATMHCVRPRACQYESRNLNGISVPYSGTLLRIKALRYSDPIMLFVYMRLVSTDRGALIWRIRKPKDGAFR
jgi:hypothetical protein